jgi:UDP-glucose 4-epimerase
MAEVCRAIEWFVSSRPATQTPAVFNLGTGISQTVLEMARLIQTRCNQVLGFLPELHRPITTPNIATEPLSINIAVGILAPGNLLP